LVLALDGCSSDQATSPVPTDVDAIVFLQRVPRQSDGNVFDYTSFQAGGRIAMLKPASANGTLTVLTSDPMFDNADIMSWDLSFDAQQIVFSARLAGSNHYHLFTMNVDKTNISQLTEGDYDYVYPIYLPGQRVMFTTNENVEEGTPQFQDEYERAVTAQVGTMSLDGKNKELGPRNVSHRVAPALMPDGRVMFTEWRHLGDVNDGHLRMMNADMTGVREAFGSELDAARAQTQTNSYLRARYVATKNGSLQIVAVGTSRDRTLQAGKLLLASLGSSEATSTVTDMTRKIPGDREPSRAGIGRYYDAEPVGSVPGAKFLVSWADGPVESEILAQGGTFANFGLYIYDAASDTRFPLFDDPAFWEVQARPVKARPEPRVTASPIQGTGFVVSALNVYNRSTSLTQIAAGAAVKVRLIEGFSGEEGIRTFGTTEFDGQSLYGEVPVLEDGSFAARVPANVPVHMQVIDKFALSIADEPIWISGRAGEQRTCGGCHENRSEGSEIQPGQIQAILRGAPNLDTPRAQRLSTNYTYGNVRGVPWDRAIQPIFDAKCVSCHDGDASKPGNPSFTVTDMTTGTAQTFVFDLRGQKVDVMVGEKMTGDFTASYLSIVGLGEILGENVTMTTGVPFEFGKPANAAGSCLTQLLNPPQRFPDVNLSVRRWTGGEEPLCGDFLKNADGSKRTDYIGKVHVADLTPDEYYLLGLSLDMGGQFFSRENKDEPMSGVGP
jgi:hypothetical protein